MKRLIISTQPNSDGVIRLYDKDYHYLVRVKRLRSGDCFDAVLSGGEKTRVQILSTVDNILIGKCLDTEQIALGKYSSLLPPIALFQGLPKGSKMDLIVRQAAEGGVSEVIPFLSEYSSVHIGKDYGSKLERWNRIVREARQQSGSVIETLLKAPCGLKEALDYWESIKKEYKKPQGIMLHQEHLENNSIHDYLYGNPDFVALAVGPEGGFSPGEVSLFRAAGWMPIVLGNTILRTETAALYGTAAIRVILLESEKWTPK